MASLEFSQEPCLTTTSESDEWTDDHHGALHPLLPLNTTLDCSTSRLFVLLASSERLRRMGGVQAQDKIGKGGFRHCSTQ